MDIVLRHGVEYDVADAVAVEDLIKSVEAHARLLRATGKLLPEIVPGLKIDPGRISVVRLTQESPLRELFAFSTVVTYQEELETEVPQLIEALTGVAMPDQYDTLVTVLVMLVAIYGISKAFEKLFPDRSKDDLDKTRDGLAKRAASLTGVGVERILAALEVLFTGKSRRVLVGASQRIFAPTRNQSSPLIRNSRGETMIESRAIRDAQAAAGLPYEPDDEDEPVTSAEFHRNVRIILHAMDKDRKRYGWAGHCPDLFDDRIPMHLEKTLNPENIFGKNEVKGDILLTLEEDENGDMQPKEFLLIQAYI